MKKDTTEFTGLESYVYELLIKDEIPWIPLLKCRAITEENEDEDVEKHLDQLIEQLRSLYAIITSSQ